MIDPSDLTQAADLEDERLYDYARDYLAEPAEAWDLAALLNAIRDLGYHFGYAQGKADVENGIYKKPEENDFDPAQAG